MAPIAFTCFFVTPVLRAFRLDFVLDSLDGWLGAEVGNLEDLFDITGHGDAVVVDDGASDLRERNRIHESG